MKHLQIHSSTEVSPICFNYIFSTLFNFSNGCLLLISKLFCFLIHWRNFTKSWQLPASNDEMHFYPFPLKNFDDYSNMPTNNLQRKYLMRCANGMFASR